MKSNWFKTIHVLLIAAFLLMTSLSFAANTRNADKTGDSIQRDNPGFFSGLLQTFCRNAPDFNNWPCN